MKGNKMRNNLETIENFHSRGEFIKFENWISEQLNNGNAKEVEVKEYYAGVNFRERWFEFESVAQVWRLVYPDGPFFGYWGRALP